MAAFHLADQVGVAQRLQGRGSSASFARAPEKRARPGRELLLQRVFAPSCKFRFSRTSTLTSAPYGYPPWPKTRRTSCCDRGFVNGEIGVSKGIENVGSEGCPAEGAAQTSGWFTAELLAGARPRIMYRILVPSPGDSPLRRPRTRPARPTGHPASRSSRQLPTGISNLNANGPEKRQAFLRPALPAPLALGSRLRSPVTARDRETPLVFYVVVEELPGAVRAPVCVGTGFFGPAQLPTPVATVPRGWGGPVTRKVSPQPRTG